jgi:hypothetical protein
MVLHLNEIRINSLRIQTQRHKSINRRRFGDELESPRLLVLELDDFVVAADDLVAFVLGTGEYKLIHDPTKWLKKLLNYAENHRELTP